MNEPEMTAVELVKWIRNSKRQCRSEQSIYICMYKGIGTYRIRLVSL